MNFKRQEGFRFEFEQPVKAAFRLARNGELLNPQASYIPAEILDISPKGMKMATSTEIQDAMIDEVNVHILYCLDTLEIQSQGTIIWEKKTGRSFVYGLHFHSQGDTEQVIISELKSRRRKEVKMNERHL